jgi:hypothetical protein
LGRSGLRAAVVRVVWRWRELGVVVVEVRVLSRLVVSDDVL